MAYIKFIFSGDAYNNKLKLLWFLSSFAIQISKRAIFKKSSLSPSLSLKLGSLNNEITELSISLELSRYKDPKQYLSNKCGAILGYLSCGTCSFFTFIRAISGVLILHISANLAASNSLNKFIGDLSYLQTQSLKSSQVTNNGLLPFV